MTAPVPPPEAVEAATEALREQGDPIHSWRCAYPDRYGPCDCIEEAGRDIAAAVVAALGLTEETRTRCRICGKVREDPPLPTLDEIDPPLVEALRPLIARYGSLGLRHTVDLLTSHPTG